MLRKIRLTLAVLFFVAVTALFLDFTGTIHAWLGWTAKVQFLPALLAVNAGVVALLVLLTLLAGRVYCSVICPLGVMQDIVSWISGRRKKKKYRFSYSPEVKWLRYGVLGLFVIALIAGVGCSWPCWLLTAPTGVSPPTCLLRCTGGETTCLPTLPSVRTAMPFMKRRSG